MLRHASFVAQSSGLCVCSQSTLGPGAQLPGPRYRIATRTPRTPPSCDVPPKTSLSKSSRSPPDVSLRSRCSSFFSRRSRCSSSFTLCAIPFNSNQTGFTTAGAAQGQGESRQRAVERAVEALSAKKHQRGPTAYRSLEYLAEARREGLGSCLVHSTHGLAIIQQVRRAHVGR